MAGAATAPPAKGTDHGGELSYLFGTRIDKEVWDAEDTRVSKLMGDYWTRFAQTGDPNGKGSPSLGAGDPDRLALHGLRRPPAHGAADTASEDRIETAAVAVAEKAWDAQK